MKLSILVFIFFSITSFGQIPQGYYDGTAGLSGQQLREALHEIIDDHEEQTYASIWTHFQSTDDNDNNKVWDMYSDVPGGNPSYIYSFVVDQCGNYSAEGDCYNREHSFPKSWFNDEPPMVTDLFQIYPTDGYVNGKRSNFPFGEIDNATWTSSNGSKLGNCSYTGYSGVVFEPIDEYKGDFARTYFYMMARYMDLVSLWDSDMLTGNDLSGWAKEMLVEWNAADPVSQKEIDRNNSVYQVQNNRNPFIDHPEFTGQIWGFPSGIDQPEDMNIRIWHSESILHIESNLVIKSRIFLLNMLGQQLYSAQINGNTIQISYDLKKGIYLVVFEYEEGLQSFKLSVRN